MAFPPSCFFTYEEMNDELKNNNFVLTYNIHLKLALLIKTIMTNPTLNFNSSQ